MRRARLVVSVVLAAVAPGCGSVTVRVAPTAPSGAVGPRLFLARLARLPGRSAQEPARVRTSFGCEGAALAAGYRVIAGEPIATAAATADDREGAWAGLRAPALAEARAAGADSLVIGRLGATGEGGFGVRATGEAYQETVSHLELQWLAVPSGALLAEQRLATVDGYEPQAAGHKACAALLAARRP